MRIGNEIGNEVDIGIGYGTILQQFLVIFSQTPGHVSSLFIFVAFVQESICKTKPPYIYLQ